MAIAEQTEQFVSLVEPAKSSRSRCRHCKEYILEGTTRYGVKSTNQDYGTFHKFYHPTCAGKAGFHLNHENFMNHKNKHKGPKNTAEKMLEPYKKAAEKSAAVHREITGCDCATSVLFVHGCQCDAQNPTTSHLCLTSSASGAGGDGGDVKIVGGCGAASGDGGAISIDAKSPVVVVEPEILTADEVLRKAVSVEYAAAANKVAAKVAQTEIETGALIPGIIAYHKFNKKAFLLLENREGGWLVEDESGEKFENVTAALLAVSEPTPDMTAALLKPAIIGIGILVGLHVILNLILSITL